MQKNGLETPIPGISHLISTSIEIPIGYDDKTFMQQSYLHT